MRVSGSYLESRVSGNALGPLCLGPKHQARQDSTVARPLFKGSVQGVRASFRFPSLSGSSSSIIVVVVVVVLALVIMVVVIIRESPFEQGSS